MEATQLFSVERGRYSGDVEAKTLNLPAAWRGTTDAPITSIDMAYRYVPWFKRGCKLRAYLMGRMPLALENEAGDDLSEEPEYQSVMRWTRSLLYRVEMNLVKYGAAYHLIEKNVYGLNWTPRFLPTNSVTPITSYTDGVTGFRVSWMGTGGGEVPLNKMVWVWEPNDESEVEPGPSDGAAALKAAGLLYAIDEMANRYMGSGGVPITAVRVPPTVDKDERVKVEGFLARMAGGFRNAFKFLVIDKGTEFEQIGSEIKDMEAAELTTTQRDNVAVALGVPPTVLDSKSANYATSQSEMVGFYMNTIIPEAEMLEPVLNTQLYQRLGLTLRFKPDELEVMQAIQLEQAQGIIELTGKPILSIDEGRAIAEYDPAPGGLGEWKKPEPPPMVAPPATLPPGDSQRPVEPPSGSPGSTDLANPEDQAKAWLRASLDAVKGGNSAAVGTPFDDELVAASSGRMVRAVYEHHWPKQAKSLQERAVAALEQYNALRLAGSGA